MRRPWPTGGCRAKNNKNIKMKLWEIFSEAEEWILVKEDTPDIGILCYQ
jgi:hypothetical protein